MTASELLEWLGKNLFLPPGQVEELRPHLSTWANGRALAKELIQRNWLTPFQVNQILQGKGDLLVVGANRLLERLGEGSMGQVFKAWNTRLCRTVAVKMIHKEHVANTKAMERFRREVQTAAQLDHRNIVLVRDADEASGRPFLVMEHIDGEDLSQRVKRLGPLPVAEAVEFARQAALGLQHAWERGIVHRDIKPGNLIVTPTADQTMLVKILDFGLALDSETGNANRLTQVGNLLGTVDYIAPEQAQDSHAADVRADIFSLGCTLFYLLTGQPPYPGNTVVGKITARLSGNVPSVRAQRPELPAGLDAVLQRMMARQPADRYQTPVEVAQALAPFTKVTQDEEATETLTRADLVATMTVGQVAQSRALTEPTPDNAPTVHAVPLAPTLTVAAPLAQAFPARAEEAPIVEAYPVADPPRGESDPWATHGGEAPIAQPVGGADPRARQIAVPAGNGRSKLLFYGGAAILALVMVLLVVLLHGWTEGIGRGYGPDASLYLFPIEPMRLREGRKTPVIVKIQRKEFKGPVKVRFEKLPDGIQSEEITLNDKQDTNQLYLMVSFRSGISKASLRLVAVSENLQAVADVLVTVEASNNNPAPRIRPRDDEWDP